ncbi:ABC transporter family protein [Saccharopolyspora erythraea NRRL 2338]|uniref:ABC transporter ATP-binding protein n=2 Tax=Saccharopolyspora erythraea TaxID=1836 RepID=A4F6V4_SACEN|nr:ATP-binding cassette domain-containing protein [Saccharopolyspora erythraea]EQD85439.1 ABC transporter ATP-binding protein [Saccharopolyspora erythraea D]PFG93580.1 ABC transporter family protein [Saccharopolyspora erythraea NRRL 2338]QRK90429.1 ATP-binding cassette domain-containing protein [Saccharopolyspora erythraea]CAL99778.1 ABC transporter ATP-binding protein [Saccharopolyspora erythraea NRRL 2338]
MDIDGADFFARGITALGPEGIVFENVDLRFRPGDLGVVTGPGGSGRTALLYALAGRLRTVAGYLEVSGYVLPARARAVRKLVLPARLRPGFELEDKYRVREAVTEQRLIFGVSELDVEKSLAAVGLDPDPWALVCELHPAERLLLSIALAVAADPAAIVVDDVDVGLPRGSRARVWSALRAVAQTGMTVVAGSTDAPPGDAVVVHLPLFQFGEPTEVLSWNGGLR